MPIIDITRPELIWPGKYYEKGNRVDNRGTALPFQVIETIKEGRATREPGRMSDLFSYAAKQDENNWHNKLIWGDNLLVLASLMEEYAGKVDLIYIDPPFATGADFSFTAPIGESGAEIIQIQKSTAWWCRHPLAFLVEAADDITYSVIDFEDGYRLGYIRFDEVKKVLSKIFG